VFVHGAGEDRRVWGPQERALAARFRVVTYSRRGHPPLPDAGASYTYETHVADLVSLVRGLGADGVFLVGHSYGAYVALRVTSEHPELVLGVVLDEAPASWLLAGQPEYVEIERSRRAAVDSMRAVLAANDSTAALRLLLDWTNAHPGTFAKLTPEQKTEALANASALRHMLAAPPAPPISCETLGQLVPPVLLIEGGRTNPYYRLATAALRRCMPHPEHVTLPAAGHDANWQDSVGFNRALTAFMADR
jgi:pimeloyl-ACP methyl ester carboxylesterase